MREKTSPHLVWGSVLFALTLGFLFLFKIIIVSGYSMAPTYHNGQILLMNKLAANYQFGDVIVLEQKDQDNYVKRLIGLPGDVIRLESGRILRNGIELSPYTCDEEAAITYVLKENEYFVIGDNFKDSIDSRHFGPVSRDDLLGKIISVYP
ncbi:MAG: signal peptidase I [Anaerolineaceae bacterium]|nr:signal peptidase I [Anaerolineaceae bacterium]